MPMIVLQPAIPYRTIHLALSSILAKLNPSDYMLSCKARSLGELITTSLKKEIKTSPQNTILCLKPFIVA